ncbi:MAG: peptidoglycan editing factor PgeF [Gammaproteobacteria bacterium]|nr:peptidoglycan editing factor PgeF [Gammaproteobacteria bacterium]
MSTRSDWIVPEWPAPANVLALSTLRTGGVSEPPFDSFNFGDHVEDRPQHVAANRQRLIEQVHLPSEPRWLQQIHGIAVVDAARAPMGTAADASYSTTPGVVCAVMTADCLPVLFCSRDGSCVAAAHAGWRGLLSGVLEATISALPAVGKDIVAWLGPAIGPEAFEVGEDVYAGFVEHDACSAGAFKPGGPGKYFADIYALARLRLTNAGVTAIHGGGYCTYTDRSRFFSFRRDGRTGRMVSLIWMAD